MRLIHQSLRLLQFQNRPRRGLANINQEWLELHKLFLLHNSQAIPDLQKDKSNAPKVLADKSVVTSFVYTSMIFRNSVRDIQTCRCSWLGRGAFP